MLADDLLDALDPEQREVATALRGPVRVLAGAGTGKTRAITHRIAYGVAAGIYNPTEVLAVTFTTRAAGEMRSRLRTMGAGATQARTFHSAALRQVRYFWPKVYGGQPPELTASKIPIVAGAARRNRVEVNQAMLRDLASEIEWAKVSNVRPDDYERVAPRRGREVSGVDAATVAHVFGSYEELKRDQGRMDMEDVLLIGAALLSEDDRVAAEVRRQYKWFVVDEFQDVSPIQSALLDLWLGGRDEICVVGDPAQTIYSFAGARASYLTDFTAKFPGATNVELVRNYRSTPQVIHAANALLKDSTTKSVLLRAQSDPGPELSWREATDEVDEAEAVAEEASRLHRAGVPLREMAVLFRINAQSESFEDALTARGIPYVVRGAARFFERQEVRQALALMRGEVRAGEAASDGTGRPGLRRADRDGLVDRGADGARPGPGPLGVPAGAGLARPPTSSRPRWRRRSPASSPSSTAAPTSSTRPWPRASPWPPCTPPRAWSGMPCSSAASRRARCRSSTPTPPRRWRRSGGSSTSGSPAPASTCGCRGHWRATPAGRPAASRRGSWPASGPSRSPTAPTPGSRSGSARSRGKKAAVCKQCQKPLASSRERNRGYCADCPVPYDEDLFESLRSWRKGQADAQSVPAFVVFSDATLEALAEVKPQDRQSLQSINGIGKAKLEKYADELLEILA